MGVQKVYRVEHIETGKGPYQELPYETFRRVFGKRVDEFPTPWFDIETGKFNPDEHFCGTKSKKQLNLWITPKISKCLYEMGFHVRCYEVPK